jgi:hypothetical protein
MPDDGLRPLVDKATLHCSYGSQTAKLNVPAGNTELGGCPAATPSDTHVTGNFGPCKCPDNHEGGKACRPPDLLPWDLVFSHTHTTTGPAVPETAQSLCETYHGNIFIDDPGPTNMLIYDAPKCSRCGVATATPCRLDHTFPGQKGAGRALTTCGPRSTLLAFPGLLPTGQQYPDGADAQTVLEGIYDNIKNQDQILHPEHYPKPDQQHFTYGSPVNPWELARYFAAVLHRNVTYRTTDPSNLSPLKSLDKTTQDNIPDPTLGDPLADMRDMMISLLMSTPKGGVIICTEHHFMALTNAREDDDGNPSAFLLQDPWNGVAVWVPAGRLRKMSDCLDRLGFGLGEPPADGALGGPITGSMIISGS